MNNKTINPVLVLVLGLVTFGISNNVFLYIFSEKLHRNKTGKTIFPMRELILNLLTFGVYGIIWTYKVTDQLENTDENQAKSQTPILTAVLSATPLRFVSMTMICNLININM